MSVEESVRGDIDRLPPDLRDSGLAAGVLALAQELDRPKNGATAKSMCFKAMQDGLKELRELAPPEETRDGVDELGARRAERLAGLPRTADQSRP